MALLLAATAYSHASRAADIGQPMVEPDWYLSVFGGASFAQGLATISSQKEIRLNDGFLLGGAIGRNLGEGLRSELEISYATNDNDWAQELAGGTKYELNGSTSAVFVLGNLWKDIRLSDTVQPYVGGGVGVGILNSDSESVDVDWDIDGFGLAGQLGAGLRFALTERLAVDAGYRLRAVVDASSNNGDNDNGVFSFYSHGVQLGASYALGADSRIIGAAGDPSSWYVSLFAGAIFTETGWNYGGSSYLIDHKTGFTVGGAVGTHIAPELRAELELSYARSKLENYSERDNDTQDASGDLEQGFILANIWKDFEFGLFTPYIGGGIGVGVLHFDDSELDSDKMSNDTNIGLAGQFRCRRPDGGRRQHVDRGRLSLQEHSRCSPDR
ncbi:porin family protein [Nordella sp. HKS 07]|uniref:outer membrane protein n=1 Tax=Nordella sp. HKS 07 TaxID=2712222 RepID=UPI0013E148CA|nr:outer membrane beta-barrel protein [Nordella sp. HKS 07]QIG50764.1 porin family protein [Nordella sp. HKS 07]